MRRREPLDPAAARELAAIDAALAGGAVAEQEADLARLSALLVAERPQPSPGFRAALDARAAERFAGASNRARAHRAAASPSPPTSSRQPPPSRRRPRVRRPLIPAFAASLAIALVALVVVLGQGGGGGGDLGNPEATVGAADGATSGAAAGQAPPAASQAPPAGAPAPEASGAAGKAASPEAGAHAGDSAGAVANAAPDPAPRKVERSSAIDLGAPADRIDDVAQDVLGVVARQQGIVDESNVSTGEGGGEARFALRIPAARLQATLAQLSRLPDARVLSRSDDTLDVNQAYVSVRRRLAGAEAERSALLRSLRAATSEAETDRLRARLTTVDGTIARLERGQRALDRRVDYSRVALTVRTDHDAGDTGGGFTPGSALDDAGRLLAVTAGVVVIGAAALVPLALLAACAWPLVRASRRRRREQALDSA